MLLKSKIAVITGGGRGIGRAIALRFAAEGAAVLVAARTETEIRDVVAEIGESGGTAACRLRRCLARSGLRRTSSPWRKSAWVQSIFW